MTLASLLTVDQTLLEAVVYRIPFCLETLHQVALLHQEFPDWKPSHYKGRQSDSSEMANAWIELLPYIYPGRDGLIRVIELKTSSGTYRRSISKIALLLPTTD